MKEITLARLIEVTKRLTEVTKERNALMANLSIEQVLLQVEEDIRPKVIEVPTRGSRVVILVPVGLPEYGFVMHASEEHDTAHQIVIKGRVTKRNYTVVCACCSTETYGANVPKNEASKKYLREEFAFNIQGICEENGIHTLFLRRADNWNKRYGKSSILPVETSLCVGVIQESHGNKAVEKALSFIDWNLSKL